MWVNIPHDGAELEDLPASHRFRTKRLTAPMQLQREHGNCAKHGHACDRSRLVRAPGAPLVIGPRSHTALVHHSQHEALAHFLQFRSIEQIPNWLDRPDTISI